MKKKKRNIIKDLKHMRLIPTSKQFDQLKIVGIVCAIILMLMLIMVGSYKYPVPPHLYDYSPVQYSNVADNGYYYDYLEEIPECGNDPYYDFPWRLKTKYDAYVLSLIHI